MSENVKVDIDLSIGSVQIECPLHAFENTLTRVEESLPRLFALRPMTPRNVADDPSTDLADQEADAGATDGDKNAKRVGKRRPTPVYKMSELGVDDDAKRKFKKFFDAKEPKNQNDQVVLCAFWLNRTLNRATFTDDDVFTSLRTAGAPKVPSRIESVISNLKLESMLVGERGKYKITHIGEDYVNGRLPPQVAES